MEMEPGKNELLLLQEGEKTEVCWGSKPGSFLEFCSTTSNRRETFVESSGKWTWERKIAGHQPGAVRDQRIAIEP